MKYPACRSALVGGSLPLPTALVAPPSVLALPIQGPWHYKCGSCSAAVPLYAGHTGTMQRWTLSLDTTCSHKTPVHRPVNCCHHMWGGSLMIPHTHDAQQFCATGYRSILFYWVCSLLRVNAGCLKLTRNIATTKATHGYCLARALLAG